MTDHVIVWDLETAPDIAGYAAANSLTGKSEEVIREALGNKFPKHIYHAIVCIGALVAHKERDHWVVDALGAPHVGERPEKELIASFVERIAQLRPQLVTFNGNTFDLPVLRYRAYPRCGSTRPNSPPYLNRYTEDALDLFDMLSSFAPHTKASLNELSRIIGLPGKPESMDGTEVERYFLDGRIKEIADYCESDVVNTYRVWLRYELFRGDLCEIAFQASETNLSEFVKARSNAKPHLAPLTLIPIEKPSPLRGATGPDGLADCHKVVKHAWRLCCGRAKTHADLQVSWISFRHRGRKA